MKRSIPLALSLIFSHAPLAWSEEEAVTEEEGPQSIA
jgi:hypothetical protein